ncbi:MAG: DNA repair exonuclease [Planctomycetia bacterium]|nr:DNA repair exonuclease [Planctomycetia bacterium]
MTNQAFRFIHAADLHLESPVNGLIDLPGHLEDRLLDAPFAAARRLFKYAIDDKIDFIILSGDVLAPSVVGPFGMVFLMEEFQKLDKAGIPVYWAGGKVDSPEEIPSAFVFPPNVHIFPVGKMQEFIFEKGGIPTVRVLGTSLGKQSITLRPGDLDYERENLYSIAVFYGKVIPEAVRNDSIQYWALGGEHRRDYISRSPSVIHYPGATLARNLSETGEYGATLVEINEFGQAKFSLVKTSPFQWQTERLVIRNDVSEEQILAEMRNRIKVLREGLGDTILLLSWRFDVTGETAQELRYGTLANSLLRDVRADFGKENPIVYSIDLKPLLPDILTSDLYEQQTILGDYLRMLHYYQENPEEKIEMESFLSDEVRDYLETQRYYQKRRQEYAMQDRTDNSRPESLNMTEQETRSFRPEVPYILQVLNCSDTLHEDDDNRNTDPDTKELEFRKEHLAHRAEVLREAAALGTELLSGDEAGQGRKSAATRQNPTLALERRNLSQNKEGKETLS